MGTAQRLTLEVLAAQLAAFEQEHAQALEELRREQERLFTVLTALRADAAQAGWRAPADVEDLGAGAADRAAVEQRPADARSPKDGRVVGDGQHERRSSGLVVTSRHEPGLAVESELADAIVASSLSRHGVHAMGGGVSGGSHLSPRPCGIFAEGGSGDGLYATGDEVAVRGVSPTGYGASLAGGRAPLHLVPAATLGPPTGGAHLGGTVFVDAAATLWLCVESGTPGLWKRLVVV